MDFDRLWAAYPSNNYPCRLPDGMPAFDNQCAIRFCVALGDGGVSLSSFPGTRCWHGHGGKHLLRGEEVVRWMAGNPEMGEPEKYENTDESPFVGRRGLIFCQNFWGTGNQGDHIDLWNVTHMASGSLDYIRRSERVWFWEIDAYSIRYPEMIKAELSQSKTSKKD